MKAMIILVLAALAAVTVQAAAGPALQDVKLHGSRNIWIPLEDGSAIHKLADHGFNSATTATWLLSKATSSAGPDDPFIIRESDIPAEKLALIRAQARACAEEGILYMPYINQLADGEVRLLKGKHYRRFVNHLGVEGSIAPCPLERKDWFGFQLPQMLAIVRILAEEGCEGGVKLEGETYCAGDIYPGYHTQRQELCYCDHCFNSFINALPRNERPTTALKPAERYPWLSARGLLWAYEMHQKRELVKLLRELAARVPVAVPGVQRQRILHGVQCAGRLDVEFKLQQQGPYRAPAAAGDTVPVPRRPVGGDVLAATDGPGDGATCREGRRLLAVLGRHAADG